MAAQLHGCPQADVNRTTIYARTFHRACELLGGIHQLALHLGVSDREVDYWVTGERQPPMEVFLQAVDVVLTASFRR
jgi:hypothetical protein